MTDDRPRNAFGILIGFGAAYAAHYQARDEQKEQHATMTQLDTFAPIGSQGYREPKRIRCYDAGLTSIERFTVVFPGKRDGFARWLVLNEFPLRPSGVFRSEVKEFHRLYTAKRTHVDQPTYSHLGKKTTFGHLPLQTKWAVVMQYCQEWDLPIQEFILWTAAGVWAEWPEAYLTLQLYNDRLKTWQDYSSVWPNEQVAGLVALKRLRSEGYTARMVVQGGSTLQFGVVLAD